MRAAGPDRLLTERAGARYVPGILIRPEPSAKMAQMSGPAPGTPTIRRVEEITGATLSALTTLRVGGPAGRLLRVTDEAELISLVRRLDLAGDPVLVLGGGSNLLVVDAGFPGMVLQIRTRGIQSQEDPSSADLLVTAAAGEDWDRFVARAVGEGWSGLEALSGIPGSVGATPIQNVGAYGAEVADRIAQVMVLDRLSAREVVMSPAECEFGYRTSVFKRDPGRWLVLSVTFRLLPGQLSAPIRYSELAARLGAPVGDRVGIQQVRDAVLGLRRGKGMVLDDADHDTWSAGSFFTNPLISPEQAAALPDGAPRFPLADGRVKTSAAWLISNSGFPKGFALRPGAPASLSSKHSLALTNRGGAQASDLLELARAVRAGVEQRYGIVLENEPVLVGCSL